MYPSGIDVFLFRKLNVMQKLKKKIKPISADTMVVAKTTLKDSYIKIMGRDNYQP
jgi:hypothetical protein